jgi:hypothetical protein
MDRNLFKVGLSGKNYNKQYRWPLSKQPRQSVGAVLFLNWILLACLFMAMRLKSLRK